MRSTKRWNIAVSPYADGMLREFLAKGEYRRGSLSRLVENAVRLRVMELTAEQAKDK
jgi:Ribbon-helix-helix domain